MISHQPQPCKGSPSEVLQAQHISARAAHIFENGDHAGDYAHQNGIDQSGRELHSKRSAQSDRSALDLGQSTFEMARESPTGKQPGAPDPASLDPCSRLHDHEATANGQISHDRYSREVMATTPLTREHNLQPFRRTWTGCITCRQRKTKCDEGRPVCKFTQPRANTNLFALPSLMSTFYRHKVSSRRI